MPLEALDDNRLARDENLAGNAHAGLIHDLSAPGGAISHAEAQRPGFRIENDQMRAQKTMPLGKERKQGVKRRLETTLRPHPCGDAPQGFHVRDGIQQIGCRLFGHKNQKRD